MNTYKIVIPNLPSSRDIISDVLSSLSGIIAREERYPGHTIFYFTTSSQFPEKSLEQQHIKFKLTKLVGITGSYNLIINDADPLEILKFLSDQNKLFYIAENNRGVSSLKSKDGENLFGVIPNRKNGIYYLTFHPFPDNIRDYFSADLIKYDNDLDMMNLIDRLIDRSQLGNKIGISVDPNDSPFNFSPKINQTGPKFRITVNNPNDYDRVRDIINKSKTFDYIREGLTSDGLKIYIKPKNIDQSRSNFDLAYNFDTQFFDRPDPIHAETSYITSYAIERNWHYTDMQDDSMFVMGLLVGFHLFLNKIRIDTEIDFNKAVEQYGLIRDSQDRYGNYFWIKFNRHKLVRGVYGDCIIYLNNRFVRGLISSLKFGGISKEKWNEYFLEISNLQGEDKSLLVTY